MRAERLGKPMTGWLLSSKKGTVVTWIQVVTPLEGQWWQNWAAVLWEQPMGLSDGKMWERVEKRMIPCWYFYKEESKFLYWLGRTNIFMMPKNKKRLPWFGSFVSGVLYSFPYINFVHHRTHCRVFYPLWWCCLGVAVLYIWSLLMFCVHLTHSPLLNDPPSAFQHRPS